MQTVLGAGRVFASHYQFVLCEDPARALADDENWTDVLVEQGYAGAGLAHDRHPCRAE